MKAEIQKALNDLYHSDSIDVDKLNLVISYIESLEYKNRCMAMDVAKLTKKIEYEMMPIEYIKKRIDFYAEWSDQAEPLKALLEDYMDNGKEEVASKKG